ncbi:MAG: hypothetical protein WKF92_15780 [Pyrinomonadaceae bacterium]
MERFRMEIFLDSAVLMVILPLVGFFLVWCVLLASIKDPRHKRLYFLLFGFVSVAVGLLLYLPGTTDTGPRILVFVIVPLFVFSVLADTWFCDRCGKNHNMNWATKSEKRCGSCRADLRNVF